tara:strand:- start:62 stop:652 length:591 start_codon:yes stop_codon:yes gene_type:complete
MPCDANNFAPPNKLLTLEMLKNRCEIIPFAFVRDAIDIWISYGMPLSDDFFPKYSIYIETLIENKIPIYKYEDFCKTPNTVLKNLCSYANLKYSDVTQTYYQFSKVNGDVQNKKESRGIKQRNIVPLSRLDIPEDKILELNKCSSMKKCNKIMRYIPCYYQKVSERITWYMKSILIRCKEIIRKIWVTFLQKVKLH